MTLPKWGLICNLTGSIFLGFHVIGIDRLKLWEKKISFMPKQIGQSIFKIYAQMGWWRFCKRYPGGFKQLNIDIMQLYGIRRYSKNGRKNERLFKLIYANPVSMVILAGVYAQLMTFIIPFPLILLIRFMVFIQSALKLESLFGLLGILFLVIGFILQFLS